MLFQIFNIDVRSDTEVYLYGKEPESKGGIQIIRVCNIISPVYFLPTLGKGETLISEISAFTPEVKRVETVKRQNIFHKSLQKDLELLKIVFSKKVDFKTFDSEYCEMIFTEFQNPVENLIISKGIMGPGIVELPNLQKGAVQYEEVKFIKNAKFTDLQTVAISVESKGGNISKFVYFNKTKQLMIGGVLGISKSQIYKSFSEPKELLSFLNETIRTDNPDFVVFHNLHIKSKLAIRDKIVCDLFSFAQGTVKGRDYSINELAALYRIDKKDGLEGDARALIGIVESMNALSLAKEMAEISGYLLNKCLSNSRAERIEYTLLHELYARKYLFPPIIPKENIKYNGGLVLDPVQGFYEDIVLLLDFNSLYPSIIQEFNVCFSTVGSCGFYITENNAEGMLDDPDVISSVADRSIESFLPKVLRNLVKRRRSVKELLKNAKNEEEKMILDSRQKALKLTANSIYGCLGFTGSRFCNFEMAAYITARGRKLLSETKALAQELDMKVIYGDTDSIMIHTKFPGIKEYYPKAMESVRLLVDRINSKYNNIEIEVEKAFKKLLLYTKKKYAALVFDMNGSYIETKGLDLVRRDFCAASIDLSRSVLNIMLEDRETYGKGGENLQENPEVTRVECINNSKKIVERIYVACSEFYSTLFARPVDDFVISSVLSRDLDLYSNASNLPHVHLALRLRSTKNIAYFQDDVVSYVIGVGEGQISHRAYHPDENVVIDYQYYLKNQILPSLYRLVALLSFIHIEKLSIIFEVKNCAPKTTQSILAFALPCCQNTQTPSQQCAKCNSQISEEFYVESAQNMLRSGITSLYREHGKCPDCGIEYYNHLVRCLHCQKELLFDFKNNDFNNCLSSLEAAFENYEIPEISALILAYSGISTYRVVDMTKYFPKEIQMAEWNKTNLQYQETS